MHNALAHNPQEWLRRFHRDRRAQLVQIWQQTAACCDSFEYPYENRMVSLGSFESVSADSRKSTKYMWDPEFLTKHRPLYSDTEVKVIGNDCVEEAMKLKLDQGLNPAILNMASSSHPGGGVTGGSGAQEENLFRRSNYFQHLQDPGRKFDPDRRWAYPLANASGVYSHGVLFFRGSQQEGYKFLPAAVPFGMIAVAAISHPNVVTQAGQFVLEPAARQLTLQKIELIFQIGILHQHDSLVLSAFGCGAFRNPPRDMAGLFLEIAKKYRGFYKTIVFAIIDDYNAGPEGNLKPFQDVLGKL